MIERRRMLVDVRAEYVAVLYSYKNPDAFAFEEAKRSALSLAKDLVKKYYNIATIIKDTVPETMVKSIMDVITDLSVDVMA